MKIEDIMGNNSPPPPSGFDADQETLWKLPQWRKDFYRRLLTKRWSILLSFLRINLVAILLSVLIARLIYFNISVTILEYSMLILAIGIVTASAAILTIIIAFLTFRFGSSVSSMQRIKSRIGDELINLEDVKEQIEPYTNGPKETVGEPLRGKLIELAKKSETFTKALQAILGRFHRAGSSTYCDNHELYKLDLVVKDNGGSWFKAFVTTFGGSEDHDFARNNWIKAMNISRRLCDLNREAMIANKELNQVVLFMPLLASVLLTFIFASFVSFIASVGYGDGSEGVLLPITKIIISISLVILLPVQLIGITKYLWSLFLSKYVGDEIRRLHDDNISKKIESAYSFDYTEALKKEIEILSKMNYTDD
ncbi:hypothetical protein ACFLVB_02385 [Chloroflexota bacterium]